FKLSGRPEVSDGIYLTSKADFEKNRDKPGVIKTLAEIKGKELIGLEYEPLFDYYFKDENLKNRGHGWKIYAADFVATEEGTGVVHIAPAFGEDDMKLGEEYDLPFVQHVSMDGIIKEAAGSFAGMNVKPAVDTQTTDVEIIKYLVKKDLLFAKEKYEHSYPHCWRCDTPLLNYAASSWFVNVLKIKDDFLKHAEAINWSPEHIKKGRWGKWLEGARDWSISRQRFWASVLPIWECACGERRVVGSIKELEDLSGEKVSDLHKHAVDKITFFCPECGGVMKRVPDVLDCWFESGSMPYAQMHYPFENKEKFENNFPAEFIAEGTDQCRCWFYYLHVLAGGVKGINGFKNVIVNGIVLAEDGKKMSKKLNNYPDPMEIFDKYSADALRYYLLTSPVMLADNLCFSEQGVKEALRKICMLLWNVCKFYEMYSSKSKAESKKSKVESENILDQWILARLDQLIVKVTENMNKYNLPKSARPIQEFIDDLSTWYIRRSRDRFKNGGEQDKQAALETTRYALLQLSKVIAPFIPFIAEQIWQKVTGNNFVDENKSVHLEEWPSSHSLKLIIHNNKILEKMEMARKIVELGLAKRDEAGIKVRQPLRELRIMNYELKDEYFDLIKDELNVKKIKLIKGRGEIKVELDAELTPELKQEGMKREVVRFVNNMRKNAGMTIQDKAIIYWQSDSKEIKQVIDKFSDNIIQDTLSDKIIEGISEAAKTKRAVKINGKAMEIGVEKV
ncbi:MAG: class I tRNA ligase family protein, partial [Patescibacteria group bacterium]|nr:class I tRNA ligase family protein [Patescibacteria group bacterium]